MRLRSFSLRLVTAVLALALLRGEAPPEPDGYRQSDYRTPTPETLKGARTIMTEEAARLWRAKSAKFVDVMPQAPRPANLPAGTIWCDRPWLSIPGSMWLPDTGYGALSEAVETYLRDGLAHATGGDKSRPLVVFCLRDCWMSWNAAKRAVAWGYTNVIWYPDGTDGWQEDDLPLEQVKPEPRPGG
jgi:PQQ-dependent catabolism-associated CXXCW motif protein